MTDILKIAELLLKIAEPSMKDKIEAYVTKLQKNTNDAIDQDHEGTNYFVLGIDFGAKYARIHKTDHNGKGQKTTFGFIDMTTGDVFKAASWKGPAKGVRGHVDEEPKKQWVYGIV
jgi:hypothetical protein